MEKNTRQWLIAAVAALIGLFLGLLCGALGGGAIGYLLGHGRVERAAPPQAPIEARTPVPVRPQQTPVVRPTMNPLPDMPRNMMGALVVEIVPDTPAERAGLQVGDVILAVDGREIGLELSLADLIRQYRPGDRVSLTVRRAMNEMLRVEVRLVAHPDNPEQGYLGVRVREPVP